MKLCESTYLGVDRQLATCVKAEGHGGHHFSVDGEVWSDAEQFVAPCALSGAEPPRTSQDSEPVSSSGA